MISREQAVEAAWKLFAASSPASEVRAVEAFLVEDRWSVMFLKHQHPDYVESPDFCLIVVPETGVAEWFGVM